MYCSTGDTSLQDFYIITLNIPLQGKEKGQCMSEQSCLGLVLHHLFEKEIDILTISKKIWLFSFIWRASTILYCNLCYFKYCILPFIFIISCTALDSNLYYFKKVFCPLFLIIGLATIHCNGTGTGNHRTCTTNGCNSVVMWSYIFAV